MADQINVTETNRSRSPWPWIIGIIVILLAIWAFTQMGGNSPGNDVNINVPAPAAPAADTTPPPADNGDTGGNGDTNP